MKCLVQSILRLVVVLSGCLMCFGPLYADDFSSLKKRLFRNEQSAADEQLKLVETLLRVRVAPLEFKEGMPLNKALDKLEKQLAESGCELPFERAASKNDFCAPLADQKIKYDCKISGGVCADVLKSLCHEAGCTYCVKDGKVHVFPYDSEMVEEVVISPKLMIRDYFNELSENKLKINGQFAKKFPVGRVKMFADKDYTIRISGSKYACSRAKASLADMYVDWVRKNNWSYYKNEVAKQPRFIFEAQMNEIFVVPAVFDSSCNLETLIKYFALHSRLNRKVKGLRIGTELENPSTVNISGELDLSCSTLRDALIKVCDACGGHYLVKGRKVTIVPRELESRHYWLTKRVVNVLESKAKSASKEVMKEGFERKKKNQRKPEQPRDDTWKNLIIGHLAECGVELPDLGGVEYNPKTTKVKVETSQKTFAELDLLYNVLTPEVQR